MNTYQANIHVTLKPVVNDPPGLAVRDGLHNLGFPGVSSVRVGKYLMLQLTANTEQEAHANVDQMCQRLLANPVIEDYTFTLQPIEQPTPA